MRLYLSSYRIGDRAGSLLALLGGGKRAAIIENALDTFSTEARDIYRREAYDPAHELAALGIAGTPLDLRQYFGRPVALRERLSRFDLVWVTGGNAFVLRRAMKQSGFDDVIVDMLDNGTPLDERRGPGRLGQPSRERGVIGVAPLQQKPEGALRHLVEALLQQARRVIADLLGRLDHEQCRRFADGEPAVEHAIHRGNADAGGAGQICNRRACHNVSPMLMASDRF